MSTSSLKSLASLTPIENIEVDPLDLFNKHRALGNQNGVSSPVNSDTSTALKHHEIFDDDKKESQDSLLFDSSGTIHVRDPITSTDLHWDTPANETDEPTDRQSVKSDNGHETDRPHSVLKVRESLPTQTMNTVDETRVKLFDDDHGSGSESFHQSGDEESLSHRGILESSQTGQESRTEVSSRADIEDEGRKKNEETVIRASEETPDYNSQSQDNSGSSIQFLSSLRMPLNDTPRDVAYTHRSFSTESHGIGDSITDLSNDRTMNKSQSNAVMRSLDSVEHSYFASFQTPEGYIKPPSEMTHAERTNSSVLSNFVDSTSIFDTGEYGQDNTFEGNYHSKDSRGQTNAATEKSQDSGDSWNETLNDTSDIISKETKSTETVVLDNENKILTKVGQESGDGREQSYETDETAEHAAPWKIQQMLSDDRISQHDERYKMPGSLMDEERKISNGELDNNDIVDNNKLVQLYKMDGELDENWDKLNGLMDEDELHNRSIGASGDLSQDDAISLGTRNDVSNKTLDEVNNHVLNAPINERQEDGNKNPVTMDANSEHSPEIINHRYPISDGDECLVESHDQVTSAITNCGSKGTKTNMPEGESDSLSHQRDRQFETNEIKPERSLTEPLVQVMERETNKIDTENEKTTFEEVSTFRGQTALPMEESGGSESSVETNDEVHCQREQEPEKIETKKHDTESEEIASEVLSIFTGFVTPPLEESECDDSVTETHNDVGSNKKGDPGMIHASKSSSTLSVKTISSSSSKLSTTPRKPKTENKKLERLLKGPYSEKQKSQTPRPTSTQKKVVPRIQEKSKQKSGLDDKRSPKSKLQVHKSGRKNTEKLPPKSPKSKTKESPTKSNNSNSMKSILTPQSDQSVSKDLHPSDNADVHQERLANDSVESDIKMEQKSASDFEHPLTNEDNSTDQILSPRSDDVQRSTDIDNNNKESTSSETSSLNTQRSNSLSVKTVVNSGENKTPLSEVGQTNKDNKVFNQTPAPKINVDKKPFPRSALLGKKKIIISSPKASERLSAKEAKQASQLKSNFSNNSPNVPNGKKVGPDKNEPKQINGIGLTPTTITIIDETSDTAKTNSTAGRIVLNNIKMNLKKKSLQNTQSATKTTKGKSRSPSPDEKAIGQNKETKRAYKTQSMSSLKVPGQSGVINSWESPKEEDALSTCSRRPSMDSVSRKSVDYRIRNTSTVIQPQAEEKPKSVFNSDETFIQSAVPCLPLGLAVMCLVLNTLVPGSGTAISGISILCCGQSRLSNKEDQVLNTMCANLVVGLAQLLTVSFFLVGWFWSVGWGIKMVSLSVQRRQEIKQQREKELQTLALSAFGSPKRVNGFGI